MHTPRSGHAMTNAPVPRDERVPRVAEAFSDSYNLAHLRALHTVAQLGSISSAAQSLFRAQSVVTRSIKELEQAIGLPLFERHPKGMSLTACGRCVSVRVKNALQELKQLAARLASAAPAARAAPPGYLPPQLLNTQRLRMFVVLALCRHMPTAADRLGVTQPAVSAALKALESGVKAMLFSRSSRTLTLTAAGEVFNLHARRALNELRHIDGDVMALTGRIEGDVTIGSLPFARARVLPEAIARLLTRYPQLRFHTVESSFELMAADLRAGDIDFIVGALRDKSGLEGIELELLAQDDMVVVCRDQHPFATRRSVSLPELGKARWILPVSYVPTRYLLERLFIDAGIIPPLGPVVCADSETIRALLRQTDMVTVMSRGVITGGPADTGLSVLSIKLQHTERPLGMMKRSADTPSPGASVTMEAVREVIRDLEQQGSLHR